MREDQKGAHDAGDRRILQKQLPRLSRAASLGKGGIPMGPVAASTRQLMMSQMRQGHLGQLWLSLSHKGSVPSEECQISLQVRVAWLCR